MKGNKDAFDSTKVKQDSEPKPPTISISVFSMIYIYTPIPYTGNTTPPLFKSYDQLDTISYACNSLEQGDMEAFF